MDGGTWKKVDIFTTTAGAEVVAASLLELGINGLQVTDANDFFDLVEHRAGYWDYYDDELLKLRDAETVVTAYFSDNSQGNERLVETESELARLKALDSDGEWGRLEYKVSEVLEEDWASNWKKYYRPAKIGERLVICPSWEEYQPCGDEVVVRLDPGMAFGTGTHESTRLCMQAMEGYVTKNTKILDLGCGSGILSISAVLLGAPSALGLDIDETSVAVASENAKLNNVARKCRFIQENLGNQINGSYGLIFANIVADVIIEYVHHIISNLGDYGIAVLSGIIDARERDVLDTLAEAGLNVLERKTDGGWVCLVCQRQRI